MDIHVVGSLDSSGYIFSGIYVISVPDSNDRKKEQIDGATDWP